MTDKLNQEIKIKAKQVTEDLINFMRELDTENNYQIKELKKDIEYYKSRIEELEKENAELKDYRLNTMAKEQTEMSKYALNLEHKLSWYDDQLTKAKEIIKDLLIVYKQYNQTDTYIRAERFLKE